MRSLFIPAIVLTLVFSTLAMGQSHGHLTIGNTADAFFLTGSPPAAGDYTYELKTYTTEAHLTLDTPSVIGSYTSQRLLEHGDPLVIKIPYTAGTGSQPGLGNWGTPFNGFYRNSGLTLASDFYTTITGGENVGGNGQFEILEVIPLDGSPLAIFGWASGTSGPFANYAISDGVSQLDRSFESGSAMHVHGQRLYLSERGVYDVTLRAWDANGIYNASEPITLRVQVPEPASLGLFAMGGVMLMARRRAPAAKPVN